MNTNQLTTIQLYGLGHSSPANPLSKSYGIKFEEYSCAKSITLPDQLERKFCNRCGQLDIPGLTSSVRIRYGRTRTKGRGKRGLEHRCLECGYCVRLNDALMAANGDGEEGAGTRLATAVAGVGAGVDHADKSKQKASATQKSKERQKKRKQSSLSSMLEQKRKQDNGKKSLNLMEFMK